MNHTFRLTFPSFSLRFVPVWRRNFLVWKKLAIPSLLGNLADPLIVLFGLGYGLGTLMPQIEGVPYMNFLAAGMVCYSTMNSATFETLYSSFSRMHVQKTWDAIMNAPVALNDIVFAELVWAACKSLLSGSAILLVVWLFGLTTSAAAWLVIPLAFLIGLTFAGMGLVMTSLSPSYDFFMYYITLITTPMLILSGVFFPVEQLPILFQTIAHLLPLTHAVELVRPLMAGEWPKNIWLHIAVLLGYGAVGYLTALALMRKRLLK
ncbi:MAG: ABC transporter permease [Burkholderiales bacterium]